MPTTPLYEGKKRYGSIILNNGNGTTISGAVLTGASSPGTKVKEIRMATGPAPTPGAVIVAVVLVDASNSTVIEYVTLSNTANIVQAVLRFDSVYLADTSCSIQFQMLTALASGATLHCSVFGTDF